MQLGISSFTYGWSVGVPGNSPVYPLDELQLMKKASEFGLSLVQFGDNLPLHEMTSARIERLRFSAEDQGIKLEVGARGLTYPHLLEYIDICGKVKAELLRFVIDKNDYKPTLIEIISTLKRILPVLEEHNITLGLENHDRLKCREFAAILDAVDSSLVGICLDSVNSLGAGEALEQIVGTLAPYTVNLHVKDFGIARLPHQMGFQIDGRPAGKGMLNVPWLLEKITPHARCHTAILEQWVVPENNIELTVKKEEEWACESINYLKNYFKTS